MKTITVIALAALLLFLGYRAVNSNQIAHVNPSQSQVAYVNPTTNQLIEVIIEEVEE